jgi:hypothetical protein
MRVILALFSLAISLQTVIHRLQQLRHLLAAKAAVINTGRKSLFAPLLELSAARVNNNVAGARVEFFISQGRCTVPAWNRSDFADSGTDTLPVSVYCMPKQ